ncbi:MAG: ABC transporter ATP-binding protein [Lentisphaeraceae bacterium]|nr:ABC transporter ATP-binding protein [Lentisphaeraceae bacterium]
MADKVLDIQNLKVEFDTHGGIVQAVRGVSYSVEKGKTLAVVGESGCGKSVTVQSIMGLIPKPPGRITQGKALLNGVDLLSLSEKESRQYRGRDIGMIFQDAMSSLNPTMTVGDQIAETLQIHKGMSKQDALKKAVNLLDLTRIPEAHKRIKQYPFEFSGGMLQRAMIAMSIACKPQVLIADEPTTALDVTVQDQVLELMKDLQREEGMAIILITHDLGVVAKMADDVAVMYAGEIVESGTVDEIFYRSAHPYTLGLKLAMPSMERNSHTGLVSIDGTPPDLFNPPQGCAYAARCPAAMKVCRSHKVETFSSGNGHSSQCWLHHKDAPSSELAPINKFSVVDV